MAQLKTEIHYKAAKVSVGKQALGVGGITTAHLDSEDPRQGSTPGGSRPHDAMMNELNNRYPGSKFIRGHLLNDHLGGLGVWPNMFPITAEANANHLNAVERPVKRALIEAEGVNFDVFEGTSLQDGKRQMVHYSIQAKPAKPNDFLNDPGADFNCMWGVTSPDGKQLWQKKASIPSKPDQKTGQNAGLKTRLWGSQGSGMRNTVKFMPINVDNKKVGQGYIENDQIIATIS